MDEEQELETIFQKKRMMKEGRNCIIKRTD